MRIGLTVGESLDRIDALADRFAFVELGIAETAPDIDRERVAAALEAADVDLCVHLPFKQVVSTPVPAMNDAIVSHKRTLLEWAGRMGAEKAVLHGTVRDPYDTGQRDTFATQLNRIVTAGQDAGVEVVVENVGHQKNGMQLSVLGDIAEEVNAPICFDVGHAYMEEGHDGIKRFLKYHGEQVSHLHVHDVRRRGDTHLPIGAGEIDYDLVGESLGGFDGTVAVEVFCDDRPLLEDTASRIARTFGKPFVASGLDASTTEQ